MKAVRGIRVSLLWATCSDEDMSQQAQSGLFSTTLQSSPRDESVLP